MRYHAFAGGAVYADVQRGGQPQVAHIFEIGQHGAAVQPVPVYEARVLFRVDGKIADAERGQVVEEVRAVGGVGRKSAVSGLDYDLGMRDMVPLHRDAQERVARAPAAGPSSGGDTTCSE